MHTLKVIHPPQLPNLDLDAASPRQKRQISTFTSPEMQAS